MGLSDLHAVLPVVKIAGPKLPPPLPGTLELCRARPAVPRLEEHYEDEHVHVPCIPPPCTMCMQFILCPFGGCRKEGDFQAQIELIFAKEGRTAVVLSPQGDASCFNLEFWMSLIRTNRVRALYISLPMHSWNEVSGSAQQLRSLVSLSFFFFFFFQLLQGRQCLFKVRSALHWHSIGTWPVRTKPPITFVIAIFLWGQMVGMIFVRKSIHLSTNIFVSIVFNHSIAECFISYESIMDPLEELLLALLLQLVGNKIFPVSQFLTVSVSVRSSFLDDVLMNGKKVHRIPRRGIALRPVAR